MKRTNDPAPEAGHDEGRSSPNGFVAPDPRVPNAQLTGAKRRTRGVAAEELRRHNLHLVLERLHLSGPTRRADLTALTGLNRSTIGDLIGELCDLGFVVEKHGGAATGPGRPSPVVAARPESATAIGIELNVDTIGIVGTGIGGHVFKRLRVVRPTGERSVEHTVRHIVELITPMRQALPNDPSLVGIGVAVAGVTRLRDGFVHIAPNLAWRDVPLADLISEQLGGDIAVQVANDADLGVLAEHRRGAARAVQDAIYVHGEVGIGTGLIMGGTWQRGSAGHAGESGHMVVNPRGRPCRCGSSGCWETEAGEDALLRRIGGGAGSGVAAVMDATERAAAGETVVLEALEETGFWLGLGIANLVNILNPAVIALGGLYHRFFPYLQPTVDRVVATRVLDPTADRVRIVQSALGEDVQLIGAAELAITPVLADPARSGSGLRAAGEGGLFP